MISRRTILGAGSAATAYSVLQAGPVLAGGTRSATSSPPWDQLRRRLTGDLILPSDASYATAKQLDTVEYDKVDPSGVVYCETTGDVAASLRFAQDNCLPFAARSGGHSGGGYSTSRGLVIDVSRLNGITLGDGTVKVGTGTQNVDILNALAPSGLAVVGGACPTVAAGGFIQGGGIGFLTPSFGIACDNVTSAQVVLASGRTVTASAQEHSDLFWALRGGGGGNFGIVTSYTVTPDPLTTVATANLSFTWDRAVDMLHGYAQWLTDAPRTIGGGGIITLPDAAPGGVPVPVVQLVSTGTSAELESEVARLLSLTGPAASRSANVLPYVNLMMGVYGCATRTVSQCHRVGATPEGQLPRPLFGLERSRFFGGAPARSAWERIVAVFDADRLAGQTHQLQVLPTGGAAGDLSRTATAYVHRDSLFTLNFLSTIRQGTVTDEARAVAHAWVDRGFATGDPYSNGETYQNFIDPALPDWRASYYAENYSRLVAVKRRYDPYNAFSFAQSVGA
ncbi:FAD-binding oxidoreductase [Streptomyces specialis]|uniref:FAD-binding oxidoreductase n=1 Tax=Streptomyces specialis TaxID=498367 RepID=UPI00073F06A6|nr:FAD-binding protein [Streptomyces specialis]